MDKVRQNIQWIKDNIQRKDYNLERVNENEKDPSRKKKVKRLLKKIREEKGELIKDRILTFFELGKELGDNWMNGWNKYNKNFTQWIYKSFEKAYLWMPFNKR